MSGTKLFSRLGIVITCFLLLLAIVASAVISRSTAALASTARGASPRTPEDFVSHTVKIKPVTKKLGSVQSVTLATPQVNGANKVLFACQSDTDPEPLRCYGPGQIKQAYGVQDLSQQGITGEGSRIVIVDAYGSPTIQTDLQAFDAAWGLPDPQFTWLTPFDVSGSDTNWADETTLDVEWSHVMAPAASLTLVVAASNSDVDLYNALKYAVEQNLGDVISLSFGENESCLDPNLLAAEHQLFQEAASKSISVLASSGDSGSTQFTCDGSSFVTAVSFPASDPLVTALGGTALTANAVSGEYVGETAWNESGIYHAASGGGYSGIYARPGYQSGITGETSGRAVPDLALNSSVNGGVLIYQTDPLSGQEEVMIVGGTSVAAPEFAGMVADGVQLAHQRLGFLNPALYRLGESSLAHLAFHDITSGDNILSSSGQAGYTVQSGWDAVTGWGTPEATAFFAPLIADERSDDASGL